MSSGELDYLLLGPGCRLVVEGAGFQAAVLDADEAVGDFAQGRAVIDAPVAFGVVEGAGTGGGGEGGEGLGHQGVDEPVVADEPGGDGLLLSRGAGQRGGAAVVLAGLTG